MSLQALQGLFASLGQTLLLVDSGFRVVHLTGASPEAWQREGVRGKPVADLLRAGLCNPQDAFRQLLEQGERLGGWRATAHLGSQEPQLVAVSAAPLAGEAAEMLGQGEATYALLLRPLASPAVAAAGPRAFGGMVARSRRMLEIFQLIRNLSDSVVTVLLTGESGTGKELIARALHHHSPRRNGPFVAVNCAALPEQLLESELFGHVRGAFTGAIRDRVGRFELADGGTLFLDEIAELPLHLQVKLLRVLQERTFERVGEARPRPCNARFVAATNADLDRAIREERFRKDLYFRLNVVSFDLPPLRERVEDIEILATTVLARMAASHCHRMLSAEVLGLFLRYDWPGNVRELENAIEHALAVSSGPSIEVEHLPASIRAAGGEPSQPAPAPRSAAVPKPPLTGRARDAETLRTALEVHRWNRGETAAALGVSRTTLWRRMRALGWVE